MRMALPVYLAAPIAAELVSVVAQVAMADGAQVIAAQPDVARHLQVDIVDGDASVTAGILRLTGIGAGGQTVTEDVDLTGGTATKDTTYAYAQVAAEIIGLVGATGADLVSVGVGSALGLPVPAGSTNFAVNKTVVADVDEAVAGVDTTAWSVDPTTPPDGATSFLFYYSYDATPTQVAHAHNLS